MSKGEIVEPVLNAEETGNEAKKPGFRRKMSKRLRSMLPKVNRARTKSFQGAGIGRKTSRVVNTKKEVREPTPGVSETLNNILNGKFMLYLGEEFVKKGNDLKDLEILNKVFEECLEYFNDKDVEIKLEIQGLLDGSDEGGLNEVYGKYCKYFGKEVFNSLFKEKLINQYEEYMIGQDNLRFKLLKSINSDIIIYEGIDMSLEKLFEYDNIKVKILTISDLYSLHIQFHHTLFEELIKLTLKYKLIIKINGCISNISTIDFNSNTAFRNDKIAHIFKLLFHSIPTIFLATSLTTKQPISTFMKEIRIKKELQNEENEEFDNVALIKESTDTRFLSSKVNIEYISYKPDKLDSQFDEFLAYIAAYSSKKIPKAIKDNHITIKAFVQRINAAGYVKAITKKESKAVVINIFKTSIIQIPCVSDKAMTEKLLKVVKKRLDTEEHVERFMENMKVREDLFQSIAYPTEESETKGNIRILLTKKSVEDFEKIEKYVGIEKVERLVEYLENSDKVELRIVDTMNNDDVGKDFEVLYSKGDNNISDSCLLHQSERKYFTVNWFEVNSNETEDKAIFFERLWNSALSHNNSLEMIKEAIPKAQESAKRAEVEREEKLKQQQQKKKSAGKKKNNERRASGNTKKSSKLGRVKRTMSKSKRKKSKEITNV